MRNILLALLFGGLPTLACAGDYDQSPALHALIEEMQGEHGFAADGLQNLFTHVQKQQGILDAIARPAEKVRTWADYRPVFLNARRVAGGVLFWQKNAEALARAEHEYGVPASIIVAIIGVETSYGGNSGSYRVMDALSTLAFDFPPREVFFRKELKEFLLMAREQQLDALSLKGSYAGAMGLPQFMPSSFRHYAVDFDGDGHIDIWNNEVDAIGSVANYFKKHGWENGEKVVLRAQVTGSKADSGLSTGLEADRQYGALSALGWSSPAPLDENGAEYWLGLPNFYVITRYNRSLMYALAVYQLSEVLQNTRSPP